MTRRKAPAPGKLKRATFKLSEPAGVESLLATLGAIDARRSPQQQVAEYLEDVRTLCGKKPKAGSVLAEIHEAAAALQDAISTRDPYLIAVRAIELGEYRYWPGALKHDNATAAARATFGDANEQREAAADRRVLDQFTAWQARHHKMLASMPLERQITRCLATRHIQSDRDRRRLRTLFLKGRIAPASK